jgi:V8-like Glu-specific endopeptidase
MAKVGVFHGAASGLRTIVLLATVSACAVDDDPVEVPHEEDADDGLEVFDGPAYVAFLRRVAAEWPDADRFDFVGHLKPDNSREWVHEGVVPATSLTELLKSHRIATPGDKHDAAQGVLITADGRVFLERAEVLERRVSNLVGMPTAKVSQGYELAAAEEDAIVAYDSVHGDDNRTPVTSSGYPERAVGVSILRRNDSGGWNRGAGSGAMIGPRAALTVAHVISPNGSSWNVLGVAPAARGISYCGGGGEPDAPTCKFPFGIRRVQHYYWPASWNGDGMTYDYGVLILEDMNWSPGSVAFGYQTATWLDFRSMDMSGYPAPSKECAHAVDDDGECGGYMYHQAAKTNSVFTNTAYYDFDVQEGQSGAPIYDVTSSTGRVVYILHKGSEGPSSYGKRLREGSFSTICDWVANWPSSYFSNPGC